MKNLPLHMAARKYAEILLQADRHLYSQHIAGKYHIITDILSRKFDLPNKELNSFILSNFDSQVPPSFTVSPLPPEICSWLTSWLQKCRERTGSQKGQEIKNRGRGDDGLNTLSVLTSDRMFGLKDLPQINEHQYLAPLQWRSEDTNSQAQFNRVGSRNSPRGCYKIG
jgi:hypothetical protein